MHCNTNWNNFHLSLKSKPILFRSWSQIFPVENLTASNYNCFEKIEARTHNVQNVSPGNNSFSVFMFCFEPKRLHNEHNDWNFSFYKLSQRNSLKCFLTKLCLEKQRKMFQLSSSLVRSVTHFSLLININSRSLMNHLSIPLNKIYYMYIYFLL